MEENRTNIKVYYRNELLCTLYDEDFEENSLEVSGSALGSNGFNIGGATSNQSSLTLTKVGLKKMRENNALRRKARFDIETFEGINNSAGYKYNLGKFYVTELTVGDYSADLVLYDGMVSFDDTISEEDLKVVQTTENTIVGWVNWVMGKCSSPFYQITLDTNTINTDMPNGGILFKITDDSRIDTYRNMLELLSVLAGGYFKIDRYGKLYYGNFKNIETGRFINETVVTDYNEDAYPCFVRKLKTSVAGFDHAVGNTNVPEGHDELELAVYENPFLRSKVTEEDKYLPAEVQGIINTMSSPVVGKKLTGGSVSYMSGYGKLGHLSELIEVRRNVIPYGGESATQLLTSKLLVTDFTYQYKNSITLKCNASVANINPSSSGLNKGVGYSPTNKAYSTTDNRLDEIANNLEEKEVHKRFTIEKEYSMYNIVNNLKNNGEIFSIGSINLGNTNIGKAGLKVVINSIDITHSLHGDPNLESLARLWFNHTVPDKGENLGNFGGYITTVLKSDGISISNDDGDYSIHCTAVTDTGEKIPYIFTLVNENKGVTLDFDLDGNTIHYLNDTGNLIVGTNVYSSTWYDSYNQNIVDVTSKLTRESGLGRERIDKYTLGEVSPDRFFPADKNITSLELGISMSHGHSTIEDVIGAAIDIFGLDIYVNAIETREVLDYGKAKRVEYSKVYTTREPSDFNNAFQSILKGSKVKFKIDIDVILLTERNEVYNLAQERVRNPNTVDIITNRIKNSSGIQDIQLIKSDIEYLNKTVIKLVNSVSNLEGQDLYNSIIEIGGKIETTTNSLTELEKRVKALENSSTTPPDVSEDIKKINQRIDTLNTALNELSNKITSDITALDKRVKALEDSKPTDPEHGTSTGVNVAYYYNSSLVGVSQGKTEFAKLKLDLNNGVVPVLNVSANASVVQNGTLTFEVLLDGSKMSLNPKFLLSKPTEFISFSLPFLEISEGKLYDLSLLCSTEDSEVNFNPNDIAISVINAKLAKSATSFDEKVRPFTISSSNIKLSSITENISTTK